MTDIGSTITVLCWLSNPYVFNVFVFLWMEWISYDNFITMVVDSLRFVGHALGLDCIAFTMVQHISQSNRRFVSESGLDLERYDSEG